MTIRFKLARSVMALALLFGTSAAQASSGHSSKHYSASSPQSSEASDAACASLTPTISVKNGRIVGGPDNGRRYRGYIRGTNGDDIIFGTNYSDRIVAKGGDDKICAFGGNDRVYGQNGEDIAYGGKGHDRLYGGDDNDTLIGGSGYDRLYGNNGNDELDGGDQGDRLFGGKDDDSLKGGNGHDRLYGNNGNDDLDGGDQNDRLFGGRGNDSLEGGNGYDKLYGGRDTDSCTGGEVERTCENEPAGVIVADVIALILTDAEAALTALGLGVNVSFAFDDLVAAGLVISQDPAAGTEVAENSNVNLVVSRGPSSQIAGRVTDPAGMELQGILVTATPTSENPDAVPANTDTATNGEFNLTLSAASAYTLHLSADDYADQVVVMSSPDNNGRVSLDITMIARDAAQSFNEDTGATITGPDGATVEVSADSFEEGVSGNFQVSITPVDVGNASTLAAFPGDFSGTGDNGTTPIVPLGTVEFEFTLDGQPINLREGQTAEIELPIYVAQYPNGDAVEVGDPPIALWSLNESTGVWLQEGTGNVVANPASPSGLALRATVSHFSWWNCDVSLNPADVTVIIAGGADSGTALIKGRAPTLSNWRGTSVQSSPVSIPDPGQVSGLTIPENIEVCFSANIAYDNGTVAVTDEVCDTALPGSSPVVTLTTLPPGPLNAILVSPEGSNQIDGFINFPVERVEFGPSTPQSSMTYSISDGALPLGLSLNNIDAIRGEIAGIPTESGQFNVTIQGTNVAGDTATIALQYNIDAGSPPPEFNQDQLTFFGQPNGSLLIFLDPLLGVDSGEVTSWSLDPAQNGLVIGQEFGSTVLQAAAGTIPVIDPFSAEEQEPIWYGGTLFPATLTATGPGGSTSVPITIFKGFSGGDGGPVQ